MTSDLFTKAYFNKIRKGDILFTAHDMEVYEVQKRGRKLVKLKMEDNPKPIWVTKMKFNLNDFYFLVK